MNEVVDFYFTTVDDNHPEGNIKRVAEKFNISRPKVQKILITIGVIDSPLHQDIMKLKEEGFDTDDIAKLLHISTSLVKSNMPYEKVIYNDDEKSAGALYIDKYRRKEKIFLSSEKRKPTTKEIRHQMSLIYPDIIFNKKNNNKIDEYLKDNPELLMFKYTKEESKLFEDINDVLLLHIELIHDIDGNDLNDFKKLAQINHGNTISRDILVPSIMPLHNLHYAINHAFGFTNSHLHSFNLFDEDIEMIIGKNYEYYKEYVGVLFNDPYRDNNQDFWDDDYNGGSPKKWLRCKYTGPHYYGIKEESYRYIKNQIEITKNLQNTINYLLDFLLFKNFL